MLREREEKEGEVGGRSEIKEKGGMGGYLCVAVLVNCMCKNIDHGSSSLGERHSRSPQ